MLATFRGFGPLELLCLDGRGLVSFSALSAATLFGLDVNRSLYEAGDGEALLEVLEEPGPILL